MARPLRLLLLPLLLLTFLLLAAAAPQRPCGPARLSRNTVLGRPGANVTLTCQDEGPANVTVTWRREERGAAARGGHGRQLPDGNALLLRRLRHDDSGRYVCSGGGRPLRSLQLLVEDPPERPRVSCYRRSHDKDVLCEWAPRAQPSPGTRAMLWVKRRFVAEDPAAQRCRYFARARKFVCRVKVPPGAEDTKPLVVSTCVTNGAGAAAGEDTIITLSGVLKPDPPVNVTVTPLEMSPQRLRVAWSYPPSWDPRFYWLRFQIRYRPEPARTFTEVEQGTRTWLEIRDAWRGTRHLVQVRAQDEFGHGAWSHWSREASGTPWTDPGDVTSEMGPFSSQFPTEDGTYWVTLPPELFGRDSGAAVGAGAGAEPPYAVLAAGGGLGLGVALLVAIVVRYRQMGGRGDPKAEGEGQHVLVPLAPPAPPRSVTPPCCPPRGSARHQLGLFLLQGVAGGGLDMGLGGGGVPMQSNPRTPFLGVP